MPPDAYESILNACDLHLYYYRHGHVPRADPASGVPPIATVVPADSPPPYAPSSVTPSSSVSDDGVSEVNNSIASFDTVADEPPFVPTVSPSPLALETPRVVPSATYDFYVVPVDPHHVRVLHTQCFSITDYPALHALHRFGERPVVFIRGYSFETNKYNFDHFLRARHHRRSGSRRVVRRILA